MRKSESTFTNNQIISELTRSPHGNLKEYVPVGLQAAVNNPEFFAHLIAWNRTRGQIRDAKVALPVISLATSTYTDSFLENSLAHIAASGPRELLRAYRFAHELRPSQQMRNVRRIAQEWLRNREELPAHKWDRMAILHRKTLKELYALTHTKPDKRTASILFQNKRPRNSIFDIVANLRYMNSDEAAAAILKHNVPFLVALGALGAKSKDSALGLALIKGMTPTQLVTNTKLLERMGLKTDPAMRGAYQSALANVQKSQANVLKTSRAADALAESGEVELAEKLRGVQEKQLQSSIEGDWLVLADCSGSMESAIEGAVHLAAILGRMVQGKVHLVFFNTDPRAFDVTGMSLEEIQKKTRHIVAWGGTSIGCGLQYLLDRKISVDGIAIVSDGEENTAPFFAKVYGAYSQFVGKSVPVYFYQYSSLGSTALHAFMREGSLDMQTFCVDKSDYYSLPDIAKTMRVQRYSLAEEIMDTPLLTLEDVFKNKKGAKFHASTV